jgi:hypothetical protein
VNRTSLLILAVFVVGCASGKGQTAEPADTAVAATADMDSGEPPPSASASASSSASQEAPKEAPKPTKESLEAAMTPPAGLVDLRPILGTDPDVSLPAIFAKVKKGMTAKELDAIFPGVGAHPKAEFVNFTKKGAQWVKVTGSQAHKELLDIKYDAAGGGLVKIGFFLDPAAVKPEQWDYLKKAALAKWGKTDDSSDVIRWAPAGVKQIMVMKTDAKTLSIDVEF